MAIHERGTSNSRRVTLRLGRLVAIVVSLAVLSLGGAALGAATAGAAVEAPGSAKMPGLAPRVAPDSDTAPVFTDKLPPTTGTVGTAYTGYTFTASGTAPVTFTKGSGSLPPGLTLATDGVLSGTPSIAGDYTFTVKASNGINPDAVTTNITITILSNSVSPNPAMWTGPVDLSTPETPAFQPQVALSSDGSTRAYVWQQAESSNRIVTTAYTVDGGATMVRRSLSPAGNNSFVPHVAVSSDGSTLVYSWGNRNQAMAQATFSTNRGATWTDMDLGALEASWEDPWLSMSSDGRTIAFIWNYYSGSQRYVRVKYTRDAGGSWTTTDLTNPTTGPFVCDPVSETPRVAVSADGVTMAATWNCLDSVGSQGVYSVDGGLNWTSNWVNGVLPDTYASGRLGGVPSVSVGGVGTSTSIAYGYLVIDDTDSSKPAMGTTYSMNKGSTWTTRSLSGARAGYAAVAVSGDGSTLAYSWNLDSGRFQAAVSRDRGNSGLTNPINLGGGNSPVPVSVSNDGMTLAYAWRGSDGTNSRSQGTFSTDGGATGLTMVTDFSAAGANASNNQKTAVSADGTAIAYVWTRNGVVQTTYTTANGPGPGPSPTYPPSAPLSVRATPGDSQAVVSWAAPADAGSFPVTEYQVQASLGGSSCLATAPALTCTVTGLANGTAYTFTVRALNGAGWGPTSEPSDSVTPQAPRTVSIQVVGSRDSGDPRYARVVGTTTGLVGERLGAWMRFGREKQSRLGVVRPRVASDGTFSWSRRAARSFSVYFAYGDVKSNTVVIKRR
jgi:hypothetical protein